MRQRHYAFCTVSDPDKPFAEEAIRSDCDNIVLCSTGMGRCIRAHQRSMVDIASFASMSGTARGWNLRSAAIWAGLTVSCLLERSARRRLVSRKPTNACEASQKILYLTAAALARGMVLQQAEISKIAAGVEEFKAELISPVRPVKD